MNSYRLTYRGSSWQSVHASRLSDPEAPFEDDRSTVIKRGSVRSVAKVPIGEDSVAVKLFDETSLRHRLGRLVRRSAAGRAHEGIKRLNEAGFPAPEVAYRAEMEARLAEYEATFD